VVGAAATGAAVGDRAAPRAARQPAGFRGGDLDLPPVAAAITEASGAVCEPVAGTGGVLRLGPASGPSVAVRAEMDGLPVVERTGAPFAATGGVMHACGHDVHLAALVALARAAVEVDLPTGLLAVLQPREEVSPTGARDVVTSGALTRHQVRAVIGAHVQPLLPAGRWPPTRAGERLGGRVRHRRHRPRRPHRLPAPGRRPGLHAVPVRARRAGRAARHRRPDAPGDGDGHAARGRPRAQRHPGGRPGARHRRTMGADDARRLHAAIAEMVSATARAHGCTGTVVVEPGEPVLVNDPALAAGATRWLRAFGVPGGASFASCGSDDFSSYSLVGNGLPILMMFVGTADGPQPPVLHDPRFLPDDARVGDVARALLAGVLAGLTTALSPAR
jgi:amidohydrolase